MIKIASFNVENLYARARALDLNDEAAGREIMEACKRVNDLMGEAVYTDEIKDEIMDLLLKLDVYTRNEQGAVRRKNSRMPLWAWLRKNRGSFDVEPTDKTKDVRITATGRADWIGWVELANEPVDETATRMTARVIAELDADIMGIVEAEDRPSLVRFNVELLANQFGHIMLVDGNDTRGIDVAILTRNGFTIESIRSHVDLMKGGESVFSRDCPVYEVKTPAGEVLHVLLNHFKSQSGGGGDKRLLQAGAVAEIASRLIAEGKHVVVMGDLNEGPAQEDGHADNLAPLYQPGLGLVACYKLPDFDLGGRPGTYDACGVRNRLDYIFISDSLRPHWRGGRLFRKGLWGSRKSRPDRWDTYEEMENSHQQASDHAAVCIELDL